MSATTTQLEMEAEQRRHRVSGLMDELKARIAPNQVVEEVMEYAATGLRGAASEMARNLAVKAQKNPLPFLLIGAGIAWIVASERRHHANGGAQPQSGMPRGADSMPRPQRNGDNGSLIDRGFHQVASKVSEVTDSVSGRLQGVSEKAKEGWGRAEEFAVGSYVGAKQVIEDTATSGDQMLSNARSFMHQEPLVVGGVGLAIGAALGAAIPTTPSENRLMGATADEAKTLVRDAASDGLHRVRSVAEHAVESATEAVSDEARKQGLAPKPKKNEETWPPIPAEGGGLQNSNGPNGRDTRGV